MAIVKDTSTPNSATRAAVVAFSRQILDQPANQPINLPDKDVRLFAIEFMRLYNEKGGVAGEPGPDKFERRELAMNLAISAGSKDEAPLAYVGRVFLYEKLLSCDHDESLRRAISEGDFHMASVIKG